MRVLAVDVGCGTTDILLWDDERQGENQTHLIVPSRTCVVAGEISRATAARQSVVFAGPLMGGGPNATSMRRHVAGGLSFYATPEAAGSFNDDLEAVAAAGVTVVTPQEVPSLVDAGAVFVNSGDLDVSALFRALELLGESASVDGCALAVQDHGFAVAGESDRTFRFGKMAATLSASPRLSGFFYQREEIPSYFTRMLAAAGLFEANGALVVGDTGPSALWGASLSAPGSPCLAVNFGNSHTLMGFVDRGTMDGLFEHHTSMLDPGKMESYARRFAAGELGNEEVFADGGHGTLKVSRSYDLAKVPIVVTGPRRGFFASVDLPMVEASIHGDMMITGCYGLLQGYLAKQ
ncbi:MAG: DUF1786 family protein [Actinobacteria bacterium]|nr:DUF1786 family protein [Actinomycetota bacterium]